MWMAYQATKDPLYLRSLRAIISHMSYSQWDNLAEPRACGGGDEGTNIPCDVINGFGANFWPETTGQGIAVLEMMAQSVPECE